MKKNPIVFMGALGTAVPEIHLSIDHLKKGHYIIHITNKEKIIKTVRIIKK